MGCGSTVSVSLNPNIDWRQGEVRLDVSGDGIDAQCVWDPSTFEELAVLDDNGEAIWDVDYINALRAAESEAAREEALDTLGGAAGAGGLGAAGEGNTDEPLEYGCTEGISLREGRLLFEQATPEQLHITVTVNGSELYSDTVELEYEDIEINGKGCGTCPYEHVVVPVEGPSADSLPPGIDCEAAPNADYESNYQCPEGMLYLGIPSCMGPRCVVPEEACLAECSLDARCALMPDAFQPSLICEGQTAPSFAYPSPD